MTEADFFEKSGKILAELQEQLDQLKQGSGTPEEFYRVYKTMEEYRDHLWGHIMSLPGRERQPFQRKTPGIIFNLVNEVADLADAACEKQVIDKELALGIGTMSTCVCFGAGVSINWPDDAQVEPYNQGAHK